MCGPVSQKPADYERPGLKLRDRRLADMIGKTAIAAIRLCWATVLEYREQQQL
jgi:hypothetical protein